MQVGRNNRKLTIVAQDPKVRLGGAIAFAQVDVPAEVLADGPIGYRVKVVDFDASANVLYAPRVFGPSDSDQHADPYKAKEGLRGQALRRWEKRTLSDPAFHAQHVYAIVMRTLARFEFALGRRVSWGFDGHQIHVAPHAFLDANAFYSEADRALMFGYFKAHRTGKIVYTCLSHDIVAHETTHAILDGLRDGFTHPSTPDQGAFHEGFADVVALLSVFSLKEVVAAALLTNQRASGQSKRIRLISKSRVTRAAIENSLLLGLGEEFGSSLEGARANALRRSIKLRPRRDLLELPGFQEEHDRGEVFAAAMMGSFLTLWVTRIELLGLFEGEKYNLDRVIEEGSKAADHLLTMAIRALDYCPPVHLTFGDYLAALLTADAETVPDDSRFAYRAVMRKVFASYGIAPPRGTTDSRSGQWKLFDAAAAITYGRTHYESMLHDREEVFRFIWENRRALRLDDKSYTRCASVRSSVRQGPDGFFLREVICEYIQTMQIFGAEVTATLNIKRPDGMPTNQPITVRGGGTLIFDEYGRIKYHIRHPLVDGKKQAERLQYLWDSGLLEKQADTRGRFAEMHRRRVT